MIKEKKTIQNNFFFKLSFNQLISCLLIIFCFVIYGNTINNKYALDDNYVTSVDPRSPNLKVQQGIYGIKEIFTSYYIENNNQRFEYRPIVLATFALEYQFFGRNPQISHFFNVLIYAITSVLLFVILSKLFSRYNYLFILIITLLFISHPIHTEVVSNLKSRDELLSFLFGMSALYLFLKNSNDIKWIQIIVAILFLLLGMLSKITAVLFIALIPITIYFFTNIKTIKVVFYLLASIISYVILLIVKNNFLENNHPVREFAFFENPIFFVNDLWSKIPFALYTMGYYIKLLIYPFSLSCYYGYNTIPFVNWANTVVWASLFFHTLIGGYALYILPKKNILSYGIIVYFIGIIPFSNILTPAVGIVGERFVYFSSFGFCIMLIYGFANVFKIDFTQYTLKIKKINSIFLVVICTILFLFSIRTITRNKVWYDKLTLFRNDVKSMPNSYFLNYFVAQTIFERMQSIQNSPNKNVMLIESKNHFKKAAELLEEGLKSNITDYYSMSTLGTIYANYLNDVESAIPWFNQSLTVNPKYDVARFNLIFCYEKKNLTDSAITLYQNMIEEGSKFLPVYYQLHELLLKKNEFKKAIQINNKILTLYPKDVKLYVNLGNAYILDKDTTNGLVCFEKASAIPPFDHILIQNVANVYYAIGDTLKATQFGKKAKIVFEEQ